MRSFIFTFLLCSFSGFSQIPDLPTVHSITPANIFEIPKVPTSADIKKSMQFPQMMNVENKRVQQQNEALIRETQKYVNAQTEEQKRQMYHKQREKEFAQTYFLPSLSDKAGTAAYYSAFENLSKLNPDSYSLADATFLVENAFYNNDKNFQVLLI